MLAAVRSKTKIMKTVQQLKQEKQDLQKAIKDSISQFLMANPNVGLRVDVSFTKAEMYDGTEQLISVNVNVDVTAVV